MQNYQQVVSQIGGVSGGKLITPEEAVVLIDDLEATAPSVHQHYSDEIALAIRSALTDAELFISYNMPAKALGPLVGALPMAPTDLRLNQRLAALHTRAERFAEAGICCRTLQSVYSDADHPDEATRYGELAERYEERSSAPAPGIHTEEAPIYLDAPDPAAEAEEAESAMEEFSIDGVPAEAGAVAEPEAEVEQAEVAPAEATSPWPTSANASEDEITVEPADAEFSVVEEAEPESASSEIDLSSEWDDSISVEADEPTADVAEEEAPAAEVAEPHVAPHVPQPAAHAAHEHAASGKVDETIEEIRFYLAHGMPEQAMAALAKLQNVTNDKAQLAQLRAEVEAGTPHGVVEETPVQAEPVGEELTADDIPTVEVAEEPVEVEAAEVEPVGAESVEVESAEIEAVEVETVEEAPAAVEEPVAVEPEPAVQEMPVPAPAPVVPQPVAKKPVVPPPVIHRQVARPPVATPVVQQPVAHHPEPVHAEPVAAEPEAAPGVLQDFVSDLESSLGDGFLPGTVAKPAAANAVAPAAHAEPKAAAAQTAPVLGEFVADIESSLGEDLLKAAPVAQPVAPAAKAHPVASVAPPVVSPPAVTKIAPPMAASAAASASNISHVAPPAQQSAPAWSAPAAEAPKPAPGAAKSSPFGEDAGVDLAEMFGELKQDLESGVASADEDPETHYNLGIAFREMGLLDEAIGELQKACQFFDRGHAFPQIMQTYTWLANCFLEKGVPEAAVRWYDKALQVPGVDGETRVALNYELAAAYEAAGDKPSALKYFMEVYGNNIDHRDVAERIKALKP